jgi:1-acyl-sn-glycerol-3-phosphate acyltransferase
VIRAGWRLGRVVAHALHGAAICAVVFPFIDEPRRMDHVRRWSHRMLRALGIELHADGAPHTGPVLVAANHISWLDILAINAVQPVRFVSKADVRRWPLLGFLVASAGTLFIERERKRDAMRVVHQMAQALREGHIVAVFPEGTTGDGPTLLPFHANLLQAAVATGTHVQPLVLRFSEPDRPYSPAPLYLGDTSLVASVWAVVRARGLRAHVNLLEPIHPGDLDRRALAQRLRGVIESALPPYPRGDGPA